LSEKDQPDAVTGEGESKCGTVKSRPGTAVIVKKTLLLGKGGLVGAGGGNAPKNAESAERCQRAESN